LKTLKKPSNCTKESLKIQCNFAHTFGEDAFLGFVDGHDLWFHIHRGSGRVTLFARYGHEKNDFFSWGGPMPPPDDCDGHEILLVAYNIAVNKDLFSAITCYDPIKNKRGRVML
jgi:hypothetical protein